MNIKQIRYFVSVFKSGSFSSAAKEQHVTVQAISKAVSNLEQELRGDLFVREARGVRATPLGRNFFLKAASALNEFDKLEKFTHAYHKDGAIEVLHLALVLPPFYGNERARQSIAAFIGRNLAIQTKVSLEAPKDGLAALRAGLYDALITVGSYSNPEIDCMSVCTVVPSVVMSADHPLTEREFVRLDDIKSYPIVFSPNYDDFNNSMASVYRKRNPHLSFVSVPYEHFDAFLNEEKGLAFAAGIPALGSMHPSAEIRAIAQEDAISVPVCLLSMKSRKTPAYLMLERWLASEFILLSGNLLDGLQ